jgi:hypothetical protein
VADRIVFPGTVEWPGENPGISLKDRPDLERAGRPILLRVSARKVGDGEAPHAKPRAGDSAASTSAIVWARNDINAIGDHKAE